MQTVATIRHGTRDRIPQQNIDKAQEQEIPQNCAKKFCVEIFVTGMAKFAVGKIWHEFLNTMAKFGTICCAKFRHSKSPPPPVAHLTRREDLLSLKPGGAVGDCHALRLPSVYEAQ